MQRKAQDLHEKIGARIGRAAEDHAVALLPETKMNMGGGDAGMTIDEHRIQQTNAEIANEAKKTRRSIRSQKEKDITTLKKINQKTTWTMLN